MNTDAPCIRIREMTFRYPSGEYSLHIPSLEIGAREKVVIIGPSGSGKTTLLNLVAGIFEPESGQLVVSGAELHRASDRERRRHRISNIGMIFQEFELLEHLTVRENILLPYLIHPALSLDPSVEEHLGTLTERSGIAHLLRRRPRGLSHGERQRVAICRALVTGPGLILADEPTGNLDPKTTGEVLDSIFAEVDQHSASLVMVTHDHSLLDRFDWVIDFADFREEPAS